MNFLKSVTSTVLNSTGVSFPFTIGERIPGIEAGATLWDIREGVKRDDGSPVTLFIFDSTLGPLQPGNKDRKTLFQLARNALKKLRTIRHPDVIKYVDSVETDTHVYIATEPVRPLQGVLRDWGSGGALASSAAKSKVSKEAWCAWGVKSIATALAFLNSPPLSQHHAYLLPSTVFITPAMEWRLGGFDLLTGMDDGSGVLWGLRGVAPGNAGDFSCPEVQKGGWGVLRDTDPGSTDTYMLAMWLFWLYNPEKPLPRLSAPPTPATAGAISKNLFPLWKRMLTPNARTRLSTANFVLEAESWFKQNPLVQLVEGLDGFELRSDGEKQALLRVIRESAENGSLPEPFLVHRVLPSLLHSLSLPNAPSSLMLPIILNIGKQVPPSQYTKVVLEPVVKLYASPDRGTRMALLEGLDEYVDKLDNRTVTDKIWPNLITGFADTVPVIREATIKAVYPLSGKLSDRILNNDLLRLLAKMQQDSEASIRTNTCILLGRLAPNLSSNTKKKVLVPAFARSLKDPFVHARVAALMALMATVDCFDKEDIATRVIPNMAFGLVDKEKAVRDQAFKAIAMFVQKVEEYAATLPVTVEQDRSGSSTPAPLTQQATLVTSAAGAAGSLAGWAFSNLSKQLSSGEASSSLSAQPAAALSPAPSAPASLPSTRRPSDAGPADPPRPAPPSKVASFGGRPQGMKLGGGPKKPTTSLVDELAGEWDEGGWGNETGGWGNDDLINVNADEDDWTAFEQAPVEIPAPPPAQDYYVKSPPKSKPVSLPAREPKPARQVPKRAQSPAIVAPKPVRATATASPVAEPTSRPGSGRSTPSRSTPNLASMSKEEKEREMARRREERKARIAAMKEQKAAKGK